MFLTIFIKNLMKKKYRMEYFEYAIQYSIVCPIKLKPSCATSLKSHYRVKEKRNQAPCTR